MSRFRLLRQETFLKHLDQLSWRSDLVWVATTFIGVGSEFLAGRIHPHSGKFWVYLALLLSCGLYIWASDRLREHGGWVIGRLFFLGLTAGALELLVDWGLIHWVSNGRLQYTDLTPGNPVNDVVLLGSPVWMPLAWACLITNLGYASLTLYKHAREKLRLPDRVAAVAVSLLIGLAAGVSVGINESLAHSAQWWTYGPAVHMLNSHTPLCIPLGEFFQFLALFPIVAFSLTWDEDRPVAGSLTGGLMFGIAIAGGYILAYMLLEFGRTPPALSSMV